MFRHLLILIFAVLCCSTAVIMIKASVVHPMLLAAWRLLMASLLLTPLFVRAWIKHKAIYSWHHVRRSAVAGMLLSLHFMTWAHGARETLAANASLIVNMVPVVMPLLLWLLARETVNPREIGATALAMAGVALLIGSDYVWSPENVMGDLICFGSMTILAAYMAWGRRNRGFPDLWLYVVPLYLVASITSFAATAAITFSGIAKVQWSYPLSEYAILLGLAIFPTVLGHSLINRSLLHLRGQVVSLFNLGQFLFAGILAWVTFREVPHVVFFPAAALVLLGAGVVILPSKSR